MIVLSACNLASILCSGEASPKEWQASDKQIPHGPRYGVGYHVYEDVSEAALHSVAGMLLLDVWKSNTRQHSLLWLTIKLFDYITHPVLINCYWCPLTEIGKSQLIIKVILWKWFLQVASWCVVPCGSMLCGILIRLCTSLHVCITLICPICREGGGGGTKKWVVDGVNCMLHLLLSPVSELVLGTVLVFCARFHHWVGNGLYILLFVILAMLSA